MQLQFRKAINSIIVAATGQSIVIEREATLTTYHKLLNETFHRFERFQFRSTKWTWTGNCNIACRYKICAIIFFSCWSLKSFLMDPILEVHIASMNSLRVPLLATLVLIHWLVLIE